MAFPSKLIAGRRFARCLRWLADERGNIGPLLALLVVPVVAAMAIAGETGSWYTYHRSQQNAADSAVLAAGIKAATGTGSYVTEAKTIATKYGYTTGTYVTVTPTTTTCPAGASVISGSNCYKVTVSRVIPLYLARILAYNGDATYGTGRGKTITASAIAGTVNSNVTFCLGAVKDIRMNGGGTPSVPPPLDGCSMITGPTGSLNCTGHAADGVIYGNSPSNGNNGGNNTCGSTPSVVSWSDTLTPQVTNALNNMGSCSSTTAGTSLTSLGSPGAVNCASGNMIIPAGTVIDVTSGNTILNISNGSLTINGTLKTTGSGTLTVVFSGNTQVNSSGILSFGNSGLLNINSPSSGDWANLAIVVDPRTVPSCTSAWNTSCGQDITTSGNTIVKLTGTIYDLYGKVNFNGSIDKADSTSDYCIMIWAANIVGNGGEAYVTPSPTKDCYKHGSVAPTTPQVALLK